MPLAASKVASVIPLEVVERSIYLIRKRKVMLDADLAGLYCVETRTLVQAVRRNTARFPHDFIFQITAGEHSRLRSQFVISKPGRGGRRYLPYAFTEQGVAMLSSVLNSERAIQVNVAIIRTFVRLREMLSTNRALASKLAALERKFTGHDEAIQNLFDAIRAMLADPPEPKRLIGFNRERVTP